MNRHQWLPIVAATLLVLSGVAVAGPAAAGNDFAGGVNNAESGVTGFRGTQNVRTNPSPPGGNVTWAHPFQVHFSGAPFLAVGTYKGDDIAGTSCVTNNGAWSSYIDGETPLGVYFCNEIQAQAYTAGSTPDFAIVRATCPGGSVGWEVFINGVSRQCRTPFTSTAIGGAVALEVATPGTAAPANAYNIDVIHTGLEFKSIGSGGQWYDMDPEIGNTRPADYVANVPNATRVNARFGAMD